MITLTETLLASLSLCAITAILRYGGVIAERGLGVRIITASSALLLLFAAFEFLAAVFELHDKTTATQIERAGIYLGFGLGGLLLIVGAILVVLACFLPAQEARPAVRRRPRRYYYTFR
jgi:hypothetical protein